MSDMTFKEQIEKHNINPGDLASMCGVKEKTVLLYMQTNKPSKRMVAALEEMIPAPPEQVEEEKPAPEPAELRGRITGLPLNKYLRFVELDDGTKVTARCKADRHNRKNLKVKLELQAGVYYVRGLV